MRPAARLLMRGSLSLRQLLPDWLCKLHSLQRGRLLPRRLLIPRRYVQSAAAMLPSSSGEFRELFANPITSNNSQMANQYLTGRPVASGISFQGGCTYLRRSLLRAGWQAVGDQSIYTVTMGNVTAIMLFANDPGTTTTAVASNQASTVSSD